MTREKQSSGKSRENAPAKTERKSAQSKSTDDGDFVILESGYAASPSIDPKEIGKTVHLRRR